MAVTAEAPPSAPAPERDTLDVDRIIKLRGATWADFQRILEIRGERPVPRLAYHRGVLQLMTPSRSHEGIKSMIGCLVEAWCMARGVGITPYGSWTLEDKPAEAGLEPDECYALGDDPEPARPDLAIEVIWTSGSIDKLAIYRPLGVREVWFWKDGAIELYALRGDAYERIDASEVLDGIDHAQLAQFLDIRPMTEAVRAYREALDG